MTKILRAIAVPLAAIAAVYGAVTFVGCSSKKEEPPPPPPPPAFKGNVFLTKPLTDTLGAGNEKNYKFMHVSNSPDHKKLFVVFNKAASPMGATDGTLLMYMLNLEELEKGNVVKLAEATASGSAVTISYRSTWSADGSKIFMGGGDRIFVIDPANLSVIKSQTIQGVTGIENHDVFPLGADGAYAIMTLNTNGVDGLIQLYDFANNSFVGSQVSACNGCHGGSPPAGVILCGIDGTVTQSGSTYSGTVYIAGHGGHIAKLALTVDPAQAEPITVSSRSRITISDAKFASGASAGQSTHKLHDVRLDGDTIYWSTFNLDENSKAHYGKINVSGSGTTLRDIAVTPDARIAAPIVGPDMWPMYCASGQTATAFFPTTMTNEGYITVIPKGDIQ